MEILDSMLFDYRERNRDYRRYLGLQQKLIISLCAILLVGCIWFFSAQPNSRPAWILPLVIGMGNLGIVLMIFIRRASQLILIYMVGIEKALNDLALASPGGSPNRCCGQGVHCGIGMGYYLCVLRTRRAGLNRIGRHGLSLFLFGAFCLFEYLLLRIGLRDPFYARPIIAGPLIIIVYVLPIAGATLMHTVFTIRGARELAAITGRPLYESHATGMSEEERHAMVLSDFEERNEDSRFLMDCYEKNLSLALAAIASLAGVWIADRRHEWVFLGVTPVILVFLLSIMLVFHSLKHLKKYLAYVEKRLDENCARSGAPPLHTDGQAGYHIGFFRIIRGRHIYDMERNRLPLLQIILITMGALVTIILLGSCILKGLAWYANQHANHAGGITVYLAFVGLLLGIDLVLFTSSRLPDLELSYERRQSMMRMVTEHCAGLTVWRVIFFALILAAGIEALTVWTRFGLGLQTTRDTRLFGLLTMGLRIHHGYLGVALLAVALKYFRANPGIFNLALMIGLALVISDLAHHFLILWPVTGSPEFDFFYPRHPVPRGDRPNP